LPRTAKTAKEEEHSGIGTGLLFGMAFGALMLFVFVARIVS
jgi:hypothetical protein